MEFETEPVHDRRGRASDAETREARDAIRSLARPRMTGSPGAVEVRSELRERIHAIGYEIHEFPFHFSAWPGRYGLSVAGVVVILSTTLALERVYRGHGVVAIITLAVGALLLYTMSRLKEYAIERLPWDRRESANWYIQRPDANPRFLVVAHRDSKSQPISTFMRISAGALVVLGWATLLVSAILTTVGVVWNLGPLTFGSGGIGILGGGLLAICRAENDSPGALDNATGLAALLGIAERERGHDDIAFLVTDAEELGLVGATAVAHRLPPLVGVINIDGLDDEGPVRVVERFGVPRRGLAPHLAAAHLSAAAELGLHAQRRDLPLGMGVDHIPFTLAGHPALTIMRGTAGTLGRIHRPTDTAERLTGAGTADVITLVSGALRHLRRSRN